MHILQYGDGYTTTAIFLNKSLLDKQDCWGNLPEMAEVYLLKLAIYELIRDTSDNRMLKDLALDCHEIEFELQRLWNFTPDIKFHRFWEIPKCLCPKQDNIDAWGTSTYFISSECSLHGD